MPNNNVLLLKDFKFNEKMARLEMVIFVEQKRLGQLLIQCIYSTFQAFSAIDNFVCYVPNQSILLTNAFLETYRVLNN